MNQLNLFNTPTEFFVRINKFDTVTCKIGKEPFEGVVIAIDLEDQVLVVARPDTGLNAVVHLKKNQFLSVVKGRINEDFILFKRCV
jgi:hypothetical protein